jgi:hypothetical protein
MNNHGIQLIELCRSNNIFVVNGRFKTERPANLTFRNKSIIDYIMASIDAFKLISDFNVIETDTLFSDGHNGLYWTLSNFDINFDKSYKNENKSQTKSKPKWQDQQTDNFVTKLILTLIIYHTYNSCVTQHVLRM